MNMRSNPQKTRPTGRGNVPVARNPIPKPHKRQNQTIRKNNTIPQLNFHSSWGLAPEVPPDCEHAFVMPSDLRENVRNVGFVEYGKSKTLSAEVFQGGADQVKFLIVDYQKTVVKCHARLD